MAIHIDRNSLLHEVPQNRERAAEAHGDKIKRIGAGHKEGASFACAARIVCNARGPTKEHFCCGRQHWGHHGRATVQALQRRLAPARAATAVSARRHMGGGQYWAKEGAPHHCTRLLLEPALPKAKPPSGEVCSLRSETACELPASLRLGPSGPPLPSPRSGPASSSVAAVSRWLSSRGAAAMTCGADGKVGGTWRGTAGLAATVGDLPPPPALVLASGGAPPWIWLICTLQ